MKTLRLHAFAITRFLYSASDIEAVMRNSTKRLVFAIFAALALADVQAWAQISIGPSLSSGTLTFAVAPAVSQWSTRSLAGTSATYSGATAFASLDAAVRAIDAASVSNGLVSQAGTMQNQLAAWDSINLRIQTRSTAIAATLLMAALRNDSGSPMTSLSINYNLSGNNTGEDPGTAGHIVYYSTNGATGSWVRIPELSGDVLGNKTASISMSWAPDAIVYILWTDDNSVSATDGYYAIDNASFTATSIISQQFVSLTGPTNGAVFTEGVAITLTATVGMTNPVAGVDFFRDNVLIATDTTAPFSAFYTNATVGSHFLTATAHDSQGNTVSSTNTVIITVNPNLPAITAQPTNITVTLGGNAAFGVTATGTLPLRYQWYFNGTILISGQTNVMLMLTNVQTSQDGVYSIVLSNSAGSVTSVAARLTVLLPPNPGITRQPNNLVACIGGHVIFSVLAEGDSPIFFQWFKDGEIIPKATNGSLTLTNLLVSDAGGYSVLVTNPVGSVTSVVATLLVTNTWYVTTLAGSGTAGYLNSVNKLAAQFNMPNGIAYSANFGVFVADGSNHRIRLINNSGVWDWVGTGVAGSQLGDGTTAQFRSPLGLAIDTYDQLFVTDTGNYRVLRVNAAGSRTVALLAGSGLPGLINGTGVNAYFNYPVDCVVDDTGNVCVAEFNNHVVRRVSPLGEVTVLAGTGTPGYHDGPAAEAQFVSPAGIARDPQGNLYVADWDGHRIRKIDTNGVVSTLAGSGVAGFRDGTGTNAQFNMPDGVCVDYAGNLFVVEQGNRSVRCIAPNGEVTTVAGTGVAGFQDGPGVLARFNAPSGICALPDGSLLVTDALNHRIRKLQNLANLPAILAQPYSARLLIGDTLSLTVSIAGEDPLACQWYFKGTPINGATSTNLVILNVSSNHNGAYWVVSSNRFGITRGLPVEVLVGNAYFVPATAGEAVQIRNQGMLLKLALTPGENLQLQFKNDLAEPVWQVLTNFNASASALEFLDSQATNQSRRFYRVWKPQ